MITILLIIPGAILETAGRPAAHLAARISRGAQAKAEAPPRSARQATPVVAVPGRLSPLGSLLHGRTLSSLLRLPRMLGATLEPPPTLASAGRSRARNEYVD